MQQVLDTGSKSGSFYEELAAQVRETFATRMGAFGPHLFATKSDGLSTLYVSAFPPAEQQHHNCNCCRDFIRNYGHAVFVQPDGTTIPALWDHTGAPEEYRAAIKALEEEVSRNGVKGQFFTENNIWGRAETNGWSHFEVRPTLSCTSLTTEAAIGKMKGKAREGFELLEGALEFGIEAIREAANIVSTDRLNRSGSIKPIIMWLYGVAQRQSKLTNGRARRNALFLEVAAVESPAWLYVKNTTVGNLIQDIKDGLHTDSVIGRYNSQTRAETYQQPVAAPTEGNIKVAQELFASMGLDESDLARRAARLEEVLPFAFWAPKAPAVTEEAAKPLFGNLKTKEAEAKPEVRSHVAPAVAISFEKFREKVLDQVLSMELYIPGSRIPYLNICTAVKPDAGRLFWYDTEERRNTFSWYNHTENGNNGAIPANVRLQTHSWVEVTALTELPAFWTGGERGATEWPGIAALLKDSVDLTKVGAGLFPQLLRTDLREAKRVVAAYSNDAWLQDRELGSAGGVQFGAMPLTVRVTTELGRSDYVIDRL